MLEPITMARPYAKAAFNFAVEHKALDHWQTMLTFCAKIRCNEQINKLLSEIVRSEKLAEIFINICKEELDIAGKNFIRIMAENKRLTVLPNVLEQFIQLREVQEATVKVNIISANILKEEQLEKIKFAMERHLLRKVKLNYTIDNSIIAGIIIRIDDTVIDGSVRGRLERLINVLQS